MSFTVTQYHRTGSHKHLFIHFSTIEVVIVVLKKDIIIFSHSQCVFSRLFSHRDHNRFFSIKVLIVEKCLPSKEKKSIWCNDQDISGKKSSAFLTRFLVLITDFCFFFSFDDEMILFFVHFGFVFYTKFSIFIYSTRK